MALPSFPASSPAPGSNTTPAGDHRSNLVSVYGTNATNAVTWSIAQVNSGDIVTAAKFNDLLARINNERVRRGAGLYGYTLSSPINSADYNTFNAILAIPGQATSQSYDNAYGGTGANQNLASGGGTALTAATFAQVGAPSVPSNVSAGASITASGINNLINSIVAAGQVCTCNCNYCTCNCNYCTCNCNYTCTCNCNYSDERLKTSIEYM